MEFIKEWTFSLCVTLIASVIITLLIPSGSVGKYGKMIVSLFIFLSLLLPLKGGGDISFDFDGIDMEALAEDQNDTYSSLIAAQTKKLLNENGYSGINIECTSYLNQDNEIEITDFSVYIPDDYSIDEIKDFIYSNLGIAAEVYYIGE